MPRVRQTAPPGQPGGITPAPRATQLAIPIDDGTAMLALIQTLIPLGLKAVEQALLQEVTALAGPRYSHADAHPERVRWGKQPGSIYVADQKLRIDVPQSATARLATTCRWRPMSTFKHHEPWM